MVYIILIKYNITHLLRLANTIYKPLVSFYFITSKLKNFAKFIIYLGLLHNDQYLFKDVDIDEALENFETDFQDYCKCIFYFMHTKY